MSGSYRMVIGPAKARLQGYIDEVQTKKDANSYTTVQQCNHDINRIENAIKQIENYNQQWISLINTLIDDKLKAEEKYYKDCASGQTGYLNVIDLAHDALNFLQSTIDDIMQPVSAPVVQQSANVAVPQNADPNQPVVASVSVPTFQPIFLDNELTFDGDVFAFKEFEQMFKANVHDQKSLSDVQKFSLLKKYLTGEAAAAIAGLPVIDEYYTEALQTLKDRFGKPETVKSSLFTKLKDMPPSKNDTASLRQTYQDIVFICRQLDVLKEDLNHQIIIQTIFGKFPESVMIAITNDKELSKWNYEDLRKKIDTLISSKEDVRRLLKANRSQNAEEATVFAVKTHPNNFNKNQRTNKFVQKKQQKQPGDSSRKSESIICFLCDENHHIKDCPNYPIGEQRTSRLKQLGRCICCLHKGHGINSCEAANTYVCLHCKRMGHNSAACWFKYPKSQMKGQQQQPQQQRNIRQQHQQQPQQRQFQQRQQPFHQRQQQPQQRQHQQHQNVQKSNHAINALQTYSTYYPHGATTTYAPVITYPPPTPCATLYPAQTFYYNDKAGMNVLKNPAYCPQQQFQSSKKGQNDDELSYGQKNPFLPEFYHVPPSTKIMDSIKTSGCDQISTALNDPVCQGFNKEINQYPSALTTSVIALKENAKDSRNVHDESNGLAKDGFDTTVSTSPIKMTTNNGVNMLCSTGIEQNECHTTDPERKLCDKISPKTALVESSAKFDPPTQNKFAPMQIIHNNNYETKNAETIVPKCKNELLLVNSTHINCVPNNDFILNLDDPPDQLTVQDDIRNKASMNQFDRPPAISPEKLPMDIEHFFEREDNSVELPLQNNEPSCKSLERILIAYQNQKTSFMATKYHHQAFSINQCRSTKVMMKDVRWIKNRYDAFWQLLNRPNPDANDWTCQSSHEMSTSTKEAPKTDESNTLYYASQLLLSNGCLIMCFVILQNAHIIIIFSALTTIFGIPIAYIKCANPTAAINCNPNGHTETLTFQFQEPKAQLHGDLAFVGHEVHSSYQLIVAEEVNAVSSLDFNFLFNWFTLQQHWILLIIVLLVIIIVIPFILRNLPVYRAINVLSSISKKEI